MSISAFVIETETVLAQRALGELALAKEDGRYHCREGWTEWLQVRSLGANGTFFVDPEERFFHVPTSTSAVCHLDLL
jgi:hypothetical protein